MRVFIVVALLAFSLPSIAHDYVGHFVEEGERRDIEGIEQTGSVLVSTEDSDEFVVIHNVIKPPFRTPLHIHHDHHEAMYILGGRISATTGDETRELTVGDFVFMPKGVQHRLHVHEDTEFLLISSVGFDEANSFAQKLQREGGSMEEWAKRYNVERLDD